ncbi:MAG: AAA family ATPase [Chloroflexi bacterium]|nr:AAA family ATPase [Chloroflexota bacterium]
MQKTIVDDLQALLERLPPRIKRELAGYKGGEELLEVVMDLGRLPEARFVAKDVCLGSQEVTEEDIQYVVSRLSAFGDDNRAGIERTLHRISAIRNRSGKIVGLSCRVGRAVFGTMKVVEDLIFSGRGILLLGRPGVGKTTMLREAARVLADEARKRVIIVDTSNEIAGDGDIPHPSIGRARRMQVRTPSLQHAVMIEAVENHMPEVIIIDEMGTELEAAAARTIAERGVQLIATAHGNTLENLIVNPTLSDLVGGIQTVTLGDEEARRRRTQKSILERKAPPTFDILVEIQSWDRVAVHQDVAHTVDRMLRGVPAAPEVRWVDAGGKVHRAGLQAKEVSPPEVAAPTAAGNGGVARTRVHAFGVSRARLEEAARSARLSVEVVEDLGEADVLLTTKAHFRRGSRLLHEAKEKGKPVFVLRRNTVPQLEQFAREMSQGESTETLPAPLAEAEEAAERVLNGETSVELRPQSAFVRRLQHHVAERHRLRSQSTGRDPNRRVTIYRP